LSFPPEQIIILGGEHGYKCCKILLWKLSKNNRGHVNVWSYISVVSIQKASKILSNDDIKMIYFICVLMSIIFGLLEDTIRQQ